MSPTRFRWGMILILAGVLLIMARMDLLAHQFWYGFALFFPLFLIAVGIEKIFSHTKLKLISYMTTIAFFILAIYLVTEERSNTYTANYFQEMTISEEEPEGVRFFKAIISLDDGDLTVREATDDLIKGHFRQFSHKPRWEFSYEDDKAMLELTQRSDALFGGMVYIVTDEPDDWYLSFSRNIPLDLELAADESDLHLNMASTPLRSIQINSDESDIYLKLGVLESNVTVDMQGIDSKLRLRIPINAGLRVTGYDEDYLEHLGLLKERGVYLSDGYDTIPYKIDLDINKNNSLRIDHY